MTAKNLPEKYWADAARTAAYVLNRVPNVNTKQVTPFELYFGKKPRVCHLRVFGSLCFLKAQEKKRSGYQRKLDSRAIQVVFVGYDRDFTYKVYNEQTGKATIARDVVFAENRSYYSEKQDYSQIDKVMGQFPSSDAFDDDDDFENSNVEASVDEPQTYAEAMRSSKSHEWKIAIDDELRSLEKNGTWDLVDLPPNKRPIHSKWVFKIKRKSNGAIDRFKARLVAKGYSQRKGIDYDETFSPVVRLDSIRLIFSLVARFDLDMIHFDVRTAFLYGTLSEEVYMDPPEGVDADGKVCKLVKSIYGLKQASRVWNSCFVSFLKKFALEPLATDSCVLVRQGKQILIVAIYVDDGLVCCNDKDLLREML